MSGRKKNRKQHRNGQPPGELLSELHSLRELLGSEAEADIPLLDQVADAGSNPAAETTQEHTQRPPRQPVPPPRPLEEADLPILFSPVDEEPVDDFAPQLSEADLELLRPLQNLPRNPIPEPRVATPLAEKPIAESTATPANSAEPSPQKSVEREEFQPELFDTPRQPIADSVTATEEAADTTPPVSAAENKASERVSDTPAEMANTVTANTIAAGENPFLPPHIRARLTGGKIPRAPLEPAPGVPAQQAAGSDAPEAMPNAGATPGKEELAAAKIERAEQLEERRLNAQEKRELIDQLMAEQLPELEQQLRLSITMMVDALYSRD